MEPLRIEATLDSPRVIFDADIPKLEISGKSFPPDVAQFYQPVLMWIDKYLRNPKPVTVFDLKLEYFNTASSKVLLDILYRLEEANDPENKFIVRWHYPDDDEDMEETGMEYAKIVTLPFEHVKYSIEIK